MKKPSQKNRYIYERTGGGGVARVLMFHWSWQVIPQFLCCDLKTSLSPLIFRILHLITQNPDNTISEPCGSTSCQRVLLLLFLAPQIRILKCCLPFSEFPTFQTQGRPGMIPNFLSTIKLISFRGAMNFWNSPIYRPNHYMSMVVNRQVIILTMKLNES